MQKRNAITGEKVKRHITARQLLKQIEIEVAIAEGRTRANLIDCRSEIVAIAKELLPHAAALAKKGRPRVLAVIQRILDSQAKQSEKTPARK